MLTMSICSNQLLQPRTKGGAGACPEVVIQVVLESKLRSRDQDHVEDPDPGAKSDPSDPDHQQGTFQMINSINQYDFVIYIKHCYLLGAGAVGG
jgi:hypothetical protein